MQGQRITVESGTRLLLLTIYGRPLRTRGRGSRVCYVSILCSETIALAAEDEGLTTGDKGVAPFARSRHCGGQMWLGRTWRSGIRNVLHGVCLLNGPYRSPPVETQRMSNARVQCIRSRSSTRRVPWRGEGSPGWTHVEAPVDAGGRLRRTDSRAIEPLVFGAGKRRPDSDGSPT